MNVTKEILQEFRDITGKDIEPFFSNALSFFTTSYNKIVAYYSGQTTDITKGVFTEFDNLYVECQSVFNVFNELKLVLTNLKWWEVLEFVEEIDSRLNTLKNINRWSKSSLTSFGYDPAIQISYTMKAGQTIERISKDVLTSNDPNEWYNIAVRNDLVEEDYTPAGGVPLQLSFPRINNGISINSVVDSMVDKKIYGKDVDANFAFENDDLKVLNEDDTIHQAVEILANLKKNDNPDFPNDGLQSTIVVGSNRASLNFPVISRQMSETFATDDSLKNFQILSIKVEQDSLLIDFIVYTRLNEIKESQVFV